MAQVGKQKRQRCKVLKITQRSMVKKKKSWVSTAVCLGLSTSVSHYGSFDPFLREIKVLYSHMSFLVDSTLLPRYVNLTRLTKAWTAINRLSIIWKSDLTD